MNINAIHQIEITSRCNLRCKYCPHPKMQRAKIDMTMETYRKALSWVSEFVHNGTQHELNLAGIGESTMHPEFLTMVKEAREAVGNKCRLVLATNGIGMTEEIAMTLQKYDVHTWVSLHRPEKAALAVELLKARGILYGVSADPSINAVDWAGQVEWHVSTNAAGQPCSWLNDGRVFVMADGTVSRCCFDAEGVGMIGTVDDDLTQLQVYPYSLCKKCHLKAPGIEQERVA